MKKNLYLVAIVATMFMFGACSNDEKNETIGSKSTLTAIIQDNKDADNIKITLDPNGVDVKWSEGDDFWICSQPNQSNFSNANMSNFTLQSGAGSKSGKFSGTATFYTERPLVAFYPGSNRGKGMNWSKNSPAIFTYSDALTKQVQGENMKYLPMYYGIDSYTGDEKITFQHLYGVLRFKFKNTINLKSISMSVVLKNKITLNFRSSASQSLTSSTTNKTAITYTITDSSVGSFDIMLPPNSYTTDVMFNMEDGTSKSIPADFNIRAGYITTITINN